MIRYFFFGNLTVLPRPTVGDVGSVEYFGRRYRGRVIATGKTRVTVEFAGRAGDRYERTVPVVNGVFRETRGAFVPRRVPAAPVEGD